MREVLDEIEPWTAARATGSRSRPWSPPGARHRARPGAKMAINERGEVAGAVSGGCVEGAVAEAALELLDERGRPRLLQLRDRRLRGVGRRPALRRRDRRLRRGAIPAGGLRRQLRRRGERRRRRAAGRARAARARPTVAARSRPSSGPRATSVLGAKLLVRDDGSHLRQPRRARRSTPPPARRAEELLWAERSELRELAGAEVFVDVVAPPPRLLILGAVDYAAALCKLARAAGWRPYVCDPRAAFATRERFPEAEEVIAAWPDEAFERLGIDRATYIAILTHDPKLDDAALRIALRSEAAYVGAMGSRRAQARRRERLLEAGMTEAELDAPGGADRPRPRRDEPRGDRALDHRRGGRGAQRARRRSALGVERPAASTRSAPEP